MVKNFPSQISRAEVADILLRVCGLEIVDLETNNDLAAVELNLDHVSSAHEGIGEKALNLKKVICIFIQPRKYF